MLDIAPSLLFYVFPVSNYLLLYPMQKCFHLSIKRSQTRSLATKYFIIQNPVHVHVSVNTIFVKIHFHLN